MLGSEQGGSGSFLIPPGVRDARYGVRYQEILKDDHDLEKFDSINGTGSQGASEPRYQSDMILFAV